MAQWTGALVAMIGALLIVALNIVPLDERGRLRYAERRRDLNLRGEER